MTPTEFEQQLIRHEGFKKKMYKCPAGYWTIGVGHNLEANEISETAVMQILRDDIAIVSADLERAFPIVNSLNQTRYYVLLNMAFNLGITRLAGFVKMWDAIKLGYFNLAAVEMLNSNWANQVGIRAKELAVLMKEG